jgi:hypothetical protein
MIISRDHARSYDCWIGSNVVDRERMLVVL